MDLSPLARDQTLTPGIGRQSLKPLDHQGSPSPPHPAMHVYAYAQWAPPPHIHTPGPSQFPQVPPPHLCCGQVSERPPTGSKFPSF